MKPFKVLRSKAIAIPVDDIDTDQIIPARFLKTTDKLGLGESLFADWRYREDGSENPEFVLNQPDLSDRAILIAGDNFGCGSSREHAPWALASWGFQVILSTSFADIFRNNALKNGLLLVEVSPELHQKIVNNAVSGCASELKIDLESQSLGWGEQEEHRFDIDAFSKKCLLEGMDQLSYLLSFKGQIETFEKERE